MSKLPVGFEDLEELAETWALPTERARNALKIKSEMAELDRVYEILLGRVDAMLEYLNSKNLEDLSDSDQRLLYLTFSLAEIAPSVELFRSPTVPDGFDSARFPPVHVPNQTPRFSPA